jgi:hypothetical protein
MQHFYVLLGLALILVATFILSLVRGLRARGRLPYRLDHQLFTPPQRAFLTVLEPLLGHSYRILGRVSAAEIIEVERRLDRRSRERAAERLEQHTFDILICAPETWQVLCGVNLDPRSPLAWRRRQADLERICAAAKLPFVRFRESDSYSITEIEQRVFAAMSRSRGPSPLPDLPTDEAHEVLRDLSAAIAGRDAEPQRLVRPQSSTGSRRPSDPVPLEPRIRTEPRLAVDPDLDLGSEPCIQFEPQRLVSSRRT